MSFSRHQQYAPFQQGTALRATVIRTSEHKLPEDSPCDTIRPWNPAFEFFLPVQIRQFGSELDGSKLFRRHAYALKER
jgi:predicted NAD-dependent protein-ADP-ribosyltransferase YbiA (DUF1768 family)